MNQFEPNRAILQNRVQPGRHYPLGPTLVPGGCNFAIYSPGATKIEVCLFDEQDRETDRLALTERTGPVWFGLITGVKPGQKYGLRAHGNFELEYGQAFNPNKLLIDPYARALSTLCEPHELQLGYDPNNKDRLTLDSRDSATTVPKSVVVDDQFDWQNASPPNRSWNETVVYETHIRGFSALNPDVPEDIRGTYLGMAHPASIEHLKSLGITAVQLLPVYAFMSESPLVEKGLTNYWGYNPVNFFAPDPRYAKDDAVTELKTLIRELHKAGIEVILDVVYNHTAEGGFLGPTLSFRGLGNAEYYRFHPGDHTHYIDNSGCGNSVNLFRSHVLRLVMDSLRYWVEHYHVDGFRFDLAAALAREEWDYSPHSSFFKAIVQDPMLSATKLIAEPWDIGRDGYQLGQFPENWYECNDKFRDTTRAFWRGDHHKLADMATRLMGSRDVFRKGYRQLSTSLNYVTYHDGYTLQDLVSYKHRHNQANLERNLDGHGHNLSANYGFEGPTTDPNIAEVRQRQKRNMLAMLFLSQGSVHILGGDELSRTQQGNNNAYCQDNATSWLNWSLDTQQEHFLAYVKQLIRIRSSSPLLGDLVFSNDQLNNAPAHSDEVHWYSPDGREMAIKDWHDPAQKAVTVLISTTVQSPEEDLSDCADCFLLMFNAHKQNREFVIPASPAKGWKPVFDTAINHGLQGSAQCLLGNTYTLKNRSFALFAHPDWQPAK